jgi:hypothetical protein
VFVVVFSEAKAKRLSSSYPDTGLAFWGSLLASPLHRRWTRPETAGYILPRILGKQELKDMGLPLNIGINEVIVILIVIAVLSLVVRLTR